jgi:hypothetical protein
MFAFPGLKIQTWGTHFLAEAQQPLTRFSSALKSAMLVAPHPRILKPACPTHF